MKEYSADSGAAIADATTEAIDAPTEVIAADQFAHLRLAVLVSSLTNPRKNFREDKLAELADSIKASGVHQPILVRPLPGSRVQETSREAHRGQKWQGYVVPTHEIVSGERRYRASTLAGVATIPALIRPLTDDQVLEIQIVENLQRDDLTELEEAEGYEALMRHNKINADEVGTKIGKSRSYVYARLKLLDLGHECKTALREGTIDASRALLIARIPDAKLQLKALEEANRPDYRGDTPTTRGFQSWLQANVMLRLDRAPFQITDARLVAAAGSCKDCPKRTGANPDLFADVDGADICTDPGCYNNKADAHRSTIISRAEAKGMTVIDGAAAKKICNQYNSNIKGYSPLSQVRHDIDGQRIGKLLGKDAPAPVLIENPWTKELNEAVPTDEAEAVLLAKGLIKATTAATDALEELESEVEHLKSAAKYKIVRAARLAMFTELVAAVRSHAAPMRLITPDLLRHWLLGRCDDLDREDTALVLQLDAAEPDTTHDGMRLRLQAADSATLYRALAIYMVLDERDAGGYNVDDATPLFQAMAAQTDTDLHAIRKQATKAAQAATSDAIRKLKEDYKTKQKPPAPTPSLAPPKAVAEKGKPKKTRLSPDEAQSGIAVAMQGIEASAPADASKRQPAHLRNAALAAWPFPTETEPPDQAVPTLKAGQQGVGGFALGQKVRVTSDTDKHGLITLKHAGKQGTITLRDDGGYWNVTFKGRNGGVAAFAEDQIEVVQ